MDRQTSQEHQAHQPSTYNYRADAYKELAYHDDRLHVPLDASIVPNLTDLLFKLIVGERARLIEAVNGLTAEVKHYKNLLLTDQEVCVKVQAPK